MSFRFWRHVDLHGDDECWPWTGCTTESGYGRASRNGGANVLAHRFAFELVFGSIPDGLCVLHKCDTPLCVNPAHLRLGTQHDNVVDCIYKGRFARGEKNGRARLTEAGVLAIQREARNGIPHRLIAESFGVSTKTVSLIRRGLTWKHVVKPVSFTTQSAESAFLGALMITPVRNQHLSFSRISRFEACPRSYQLHYLEKQQAEPGLPLRFGKLIHAVLERLLKEVLDDERSGSLSEERAVELYREAWSAEGLTGIAAFEEGLQILRDFVREQGVVDHRSVLAIEKEFRLPVGSFEVLGFIDRVDWVDDETIEVIDYKTNRQLFTRDEVETSLQMSLYETAARRLWPWAKKVKLTFWMLRHGVRQRTERTEQQLADALTYVETLGTQTETAQEFPARLNSNCCYCDHRSQCPAYADALKGKREFVCSDLADLEAVAREREEVARLAKALHARKEELEDVLKAHLKETDELLLGGIRYRMFNTTSLDYSLEPTLKILAEATGRPCETLLEQLGTVDKKALEALLKSLGKELARPRVSLLKAELEAHAGKTHSPRFWAKAALGGER